MAVRPDPLMFLGLDLGASSVKALLVDGEQQVVAHAEAPLTVVSVAPDRREQDPLAWWQALLSIMDTLRRDQPGGVSAIKAIGLSGQMHGAVLLDADGAVLRPCILWNDGRSSEECCLLVERLPDLAATTGNMAMPGFTAPKLLWVQRHEPDIFANLAAVLLPKAWIRYRLTGSDGSALSAPHVEHPWRVNSAVGSAIHSTASLRPWHGLNRRKQFGAAKAFRSNRRCSF